MPLRDIFIFIISIAVIIKSADFFTSGASGIARVLRIPPFIIGLTIISLATSAPEFTVSIVSSRLNVGGMAVGNALGSCIANIGLVLGIAALFRPIRFHPRLLKVELRFFICIIIFLFFIMLNFRSGGEILQEGYLGFGDGIALSVLLIAAFIYVILREVKIRKISSKKESFPGNIKKDLIKFSLGAAGVIASAKYGIVPSGINLARFMDVPEIVVGISLVAVGTSLPELFTVLVAAFKKMGDIAAGTIIGSNIVNILWVLGGASLVRGLVIDKQTLLVTMPLTLFFTLLMLIFVRRGFKLVRWEGALLLFFYMGYIVYLFKFAY